MEKNQKIFRNLPLAFARVVQKWEGHGMQIIEKVKSLESQIDNMSSITIDEVMEITGIANPSRARALMTSLGGFTPNGGNYEEATSWEFDFDSV